MAITSRLIGKIGGAEVEEVPFALTGATGSGASHTLATVTVPPGGRVLVAINSNITRNTSTPRLQIGGLRTGTITTTGAARHIHIVTESTTAALVTSSNISGTDISGTVYIAELD